jgi:hypothetical protein
MLTYKHCKEPALIRCYIVRGCRKLQPYLRVPEIAGGSCIAVQHVRCYSRLPVPLDYWFRAFQVCYLKTPSAAEIM